MLNINALVRAGNFSTLSAHHLAGRRWCLADLKELRAPNGQQIADVCCCFFHFLDAPIAQHLICYAKRYRSRFPITVQIGKWQRIDSRLVQFFHPCEKKKKKEKKNRFSADFWWWYKKWTEDRARGPAERSLCALICRGRHVLVMAPRRKSKRPGLNGSWTLVPFLSESWRCDTDLVSCQRTTHGIERGGNERLSTQHRAECAALNLL